METVPFKPKLALSKSSSIGLNHFEQNIVHEKVRKNSH
jgi:hypothetical protein